MKKIVVAALAAALICGCKGNEPFKRVCPIPADVDLTDIKEATLSASFSSDDFNWRGSNLTLTLYSKDIYNAADIASLQKGDTLVFKGDEIVVSSLKRDGVNLTVNGGIEEGGAYLQQLDANTWRSLLLDDHFAYEKIGTVELFLDDNFTITDCGSEPDDPKVTVSTGQKAYIDDLPEYKKIFSELDTEVSIKHGTIVSINRRWIP